MATKRLTILNNIHTNLTNGVQDFREEGDYVAASVWGDINDAVADLIAAEEEYINE